MHVRAAPPVNSVPEGKCCHKFATDRDMLCDVDGQLLELLTTEHPAAGLDLNQTLLSIPLMCTWHVAPIFGVNGGAPVPLLCLESSHGCVVAEP